MPDVGGCQHHRRSKKFRPQKAQESQRKGFQFKSLFCALCAFQNSQEQAMLAATPRLIITARRSIVFRCRNPILKSRVNRNEREGTVFRTNSPSYFAPCRKRTNLRKLGDRRTRPAWVQTQSWHVISDSACARTQRLSTFKREAGRTTTTALLSCYRYWAKGVGYRKSKSARAGRRTI